ncbi:MAG: methyltransferase domain-containing protein [Chthoniobacterales bacterium]
MDWNLRYKENDTPWDKGAGHPVLSGKLFGSAMGGRVLVPGCGVGHDVRALAAAGVECVGLDISPIALKQASAFAQGKGSSYVLGDFLQLPVALRGGFDTIFEHTCFCAIEPDRRPDYAQAAHLALRSGGRLCGIFYAEPDNDDDGPPYGCTRAELDLLFDGKFRLLEERGGIPTYAGREGRELLRIMEKI